MKKLLICALLSLSIGAYAQVATNPPGYSVIQDEGISLPRSQTLDMRGSAVQCSGTSSKTTCTVTGGVGGGQVDSVRAGTGISINSSRRQLPPQLHFSV